jgi:hypothetical protein
MKLSVEAGKRAAADLPDPSAPFSPGSTQRAAMTFPASPPVVAGAAPAEDKLSRFYEPCPQGEDCAGDGKHRRLFDCEQGCGFRGCAACMEVHDSEPHAGDSETMLEMFRNGGHSGG